MATGRSILGFIFSGLGIIPNQLIGWVLYALCKRRCIVQAARSISAIFCFTENGLNERIYHSCASKNLCLLSGEWYIHIPSLNLCQTMKHPNTKPEKSPRRQGSYWLYGIHAVKSALANGKRKVLRAVATQQSADKIRHDCKQRNVT